MRVSTPVPTEHLMPSLVPTSEASGEMANVVEDSSPRPSGVHMDRSSLLIETILDEDTAKVEYRNLRRTPVWGATMNTIAFMAVPRSLPACFAATGWTLGWTPNLQFHRHLRYRNIAWGGLRSHARRALLFSLSGRRGVSDIRGSLGLLTQCAVALALCRAGSDRHAAVLVLLPHWRLGAHLL